MYFSHQEAVWASSMVPSYFSFTMLSVEQCRKIDPSIKDLSDEQLRGVIEALYQLGELAFDSWLAKSGVSKNPERVVHHQK